VIRFVVPAALLAAVAGLVAAPAVPGEAPALVRHDAHLHLHPGLTTFALAAFDAAGVRRGLNLSGGWPGASAGPARWRPEPAGERFAACLEVSRATGGRLLCSCNVDWSRVDEPGFGEAMAATLERAVARGAAGLKISKALGLGVRGADGELLAVDDPRLDPLWDRAGRLGVPVTIHTADPRAFFAAPDETNERYEELRAHPSWSFWSAGVPTREALLAARNRVIARHPDTIFIGAHLGNDPEELDVVARWLERYPNFQVDTAARLGEIGRHSPREVAGFFRRYRTRVLFGSDLMISGRGVVLGAGQRIVPRTTAPVVAWYLEHFRFFETRGRMPNPIPIQGRWDISAVGLEADVLRDIYQRNAERVIFHPWDRRQDH